MSGWLRAAGIIGQIASLGLLAIMPDPPEVAGAWPCLEKGGQVTEGRGGGRAGEERIEEEGRSVHMVGTPQIPVMSSKLCC